MLRQYELVERVKAYDPAANEDLINRAYVYSVKVHGSQQRASGDPYFAHPIEVAGILTRYRLDTATIVTALLHDTVEDTATTIDEIEKGFGGEVAKLVDGVTKLSVDLTVPALVPQVLAALDAPARAAAAVRAALDRKDAAGVDVAAAPLGQGATVFGLLLRAAGAAETALDKLSRIPLPDAARREAERLGAVAQALTAALPGTAFTIDPVESRGLEYHMGVSFTIFRAGVRGEIGLGGRYLAGRADGGRAQEPGTGFTLYLDPILRALPEPKPGERVYVPFGTPADIAAGLRENNHRTVAGLEPEPKDDALAEARRLGCSHLWQAGKIVPVS